MATSYALCLGVNAVDKKHYGTAKGYSTADDSAQKLHEHFLKAGIESTCLTHEEVLYEDVKSYLLSASEALVKDDTLYLSFSGHGARVTENAGFKEEALSYEDRGWCLYNRVVFYFELWEWARRFASGVNIVVLSDCCYSGIMDITSVHFEAFGGEDVKNWAEYEYLYEPIILNSHRPMEFQIPPAVLILSASARNSDSYESTKYTVFMESIIASMMNYGGDLNYFHLYAKLVKDVTAMRKKQTPRWHYIQGHVENNLPHLNIFNMEKSDTEHKLHMELAAAYEVVAHSFYGAEDQLRIEVANPNGNLNFLSLSRVKADIPSNVDQNVNGTEPWVHPTHHHLIIKFDETGAGTPNPIIVNDTHYYDDNPKMNVDVICAEVNGGSSTGKKVKRAVAMVKEGGGGDGG